MDELLHGYDDISHYDHLYSDIDTDSIYFE